MGLAGLIFLWEQEEVLKNLPALRRLTLLSVFALTALHYLYADTALRIARLPTVIVFAAAPALPSPSIQ
jgi:hypothetical protein